MRVRGTPRNHAYTGQTRNRRNRNDRRCHNRARGNIPTAQKGHTMNKNTMIKVALFGAVSALVIDHFFKPTLAKTVGLS